MARDEEAKLIARAQRGSADAYRCLVDAYKERLFAFIWRMVRDHHDAEEITQAAFVRAYEALRTYNSRWAFSTWLFTIAYRLCVNQSRRRRPLSGDVDLDRVDGGAVSAPDAVANSEEAERLRELIWTAVDDLTPPQKASVLLFYREGKSCEEIGRILKIPAVTVKSHLHRARARLRDALEHEVSDDWAKLPLPADARSA